MIEKKLTDKIEDTVAGAITQEALFADPAQEEPPAPAVITEDPSADNPVLQQDEAVPVPDVKEEGVQVAGIVSGAATWMSKRALEAEKRSGYELPEKAVQELGGRLVIREAPEEVVGMANAFLQGDYVKGINLPDISNLGPEGLDYGQYLQNLKNVNRELFEQSRRGTLNMDELLQAAKAKDMDRLIYAWGKRTPGEASNAEDLLAGIIALDHVMRGTAAKIDEFDALPAGAAKDAARTQAMQLINLEAQIAANVSGAASEAGRALYALSSLKKAGFPDAARRVEQLYGLEGAQSFEHMLHLYRALENPNQRMQFVERGLVAKGMDAMIEVWINSILTSPVTHMVNIAGNQVFQFMHVIEAAGAAGIGKVRSTLTGNPSRVRIRESMAMLEGMRAGFFDAIILAGKTGLTEEAGDAVSKIDTRQRRAIGTTGDPRVIAQEIKDGNVGAAIINTFGVYARLGGRALIMEDEYFKVMGGRMSLYRSAQVEAQNAYDGAIQSGKSVEEAKAAYIERKTEVLQDPPPGVVTDAKDAAKQMTFQEELNYLAGMQHAVSHPLLKLFVPFFKTPVNVMAEAFARTPFALIPFEGNKTLEMLKKGGRDADIAMSRMGVGSTILASMAYASMGLYGKDDEVIILGAGPTSPAARRSLQNQGMLPYSVNIRQEDGTYKSITYSRFDPVSGVLAMAADFAYYAQYEDDDDMLSAVATAAMLSISEYALQQPMLQGMAEVGMALSTPDPTARSEMLQELFSEKIGSAALSVLPTVSSFTAGIERLNDPEKRSAEIPPGTIPFTDIELTDTPAWARGFYTALQKAKARNPFFNKDLPQELNDWGEPMMEGTGAGWEFISPIRIQDTKYSEVDAELQRLGGGISRTPKKISGVRLNRDHILRWKELTNTLDGFGRHPENPDYDSSTVLKEDLNSYIFTEDYLNLIDDDERLSQLMAKIGNARSVAKEELYKEFPELKDKVDAAK